MFLKIACNNVRFESILWKGSTGKLSVYTGPCQISADLNITSRQEKVVTIILRIFMRTHLKHADSKAHELWCRVLNLMFLEKTDCLCIQRWSPLAPSFGKNVQRAKRSESAFWSCFNIKYQTNTIPSLVRHPTFYDKLYVSDSIKNVNRLSK